MNRLAWAEMNLIVAKVIWSFDLELSENNVEDWSDQKVWMLNEPLPLNVKITTRAWQASRNAAGLIAAWNIWSVWDSYIYSCKGYGFRTMAMLGFWFKVRNKKMAEEKAGRRGGGKGGWAGGIENGDGEGGFVGAEMFPLPT